MAEFTRYALYFTPPPGSLCDMGAAWLGWDLVAGAQVAHRDPALSEITENPRKYGFHATMKPPFQLAENQNEAALSKAVGAFCATQAPVTLDALEVTPLGRFLALTPVGDVAALNQLASAVVTFFEPFRAPMSPTEHARRKSAFLNPAQQENLARYGYPHVLDQFRFHITLTGRLPKPQMAEIRPLAEAAFAPVVPNPMAIEALTLCGERPDGQFQQIERKPFKGAPI